MKFFLKRKIRKVYLSKRLNYDSGELQSKSEAICRKLAHFIHERKVRTIMAYHPMKNEVNVLPLVSQLLKEGRESGKHKEIYFPKVFKKPLMGPVLVNRLSDLKPGYRGILEPPHLKKLKASLDLVIVPGLAFTSGRYRLGYGGGFYDHYLESNEPRYSCGVFYDFQKVFFLPKQKNDIRINLVITESKTYD